ncbi:MAG TPA: hypothetical protein VNK52_12855 [Hyphomicrobiaceae bacterium]|nr:hypothetical protein [Hyphomicrobiaceae bacterium]
MIESNNSASPSGERSDDAPAAGEVAGNPSLSVFDAGAEKTFTSMLADGLAANLEDAEGAVLAGAHEYDGHVALALDAGLLPNIDTALDLLTSSHHLFDVPAVDLGAVADDS